ncbi:MAG: hypothetical protein UV74_C0001G0055 [Candidatus Woesebacteria bacterium GW2011_GWB1_43_14]|uniref:Apea-like HEPN domain-containing protein n=1 Tax=Candidatus Woesebacteria bacterium GW2011_GWB1_43_14 TaxID=1618578 RepID=A0A0G1DM33_9BACT|nr:MAG: hypothetical protein UT21_C0003G0026 [Candidatus Woesebacteria bacterium GW2011_GWA1_39_11b]KKS78208.1 MAG: hypothetical protein UV51_C0002G0044 [Candidatus Woesebacteria bacterium GW2011_GWC1_42_9]KKS98945.1 MAG: hypothetical protein UV74_C0001G0055 [Candidatus Woesebacteria bacterium GW2011_GWB1_43_14]
MMKKTTASWRYLFKLPVNTYNNDDPYYELKPLPLSDQKRVVIFAGKNDASLRGLGVVYIYLELSKELNAQNTFANLQRLLNLIYLETGLPTRYSAVRLNKAKEIKDVLKYFGSLKHNDSKSYSGTAPENNHIFRVKGCVELMWGLTKKDFEKFDNALNTFVWASELMEIPNPHLKYTLYMTLFLSSINQLANNPVFCKGHPFCSVCKKRVNHQTKSERQAIVDLIKELLTGKNLDQATKMVKRLYSKLRSAFLHSGFLSGKEKEGGFLANGITDTAPLMEDMMNTLVINRKLLEQFLVKRQP